MHYFFLTKHRFASHLSVATIAAFLQCPAFFSSCSGKEAKNTEEAQIYIEWTKNPTPEALDLLFFYLDGAEKLDSYHQVIPSGGRMFGLSGKGARRLVVISGRSGETAFWADIINYGSLSKKTFLLSDEDPSCPRLYGETEIADEISRTVSLTLVPMIAGIRINSVSCDFSGRPYAGKTFFNKLSYLTYAGVEYRPLGADKGTVSRINGGALDSTACLALPHPEMILKEGLGEVGIRKEFPDGTFYCYEGDRDTPVRLVLEGSVDSKTCYYPIELPEVKAGTLLSLDIVLRMIGTGDPDTPVEKGTVLLEGRVVPWEETGPEEICF